jgi:hypothetical protein
MPSLTDSDHPCALCGAPPSEQPGRTLTALDRQDIAEVVHDMLRPIVELAEQLEPYRAMLPAPDSPRATVYRGLARALRS